MKKLFIASLVVFSMVFVQAQEVTVLEEVNLGFSPLNSSVIQKGNKFTFRVKNVRSNDLIKYPIQFLKDNFNIKNFIASVESQKYDSYEVTLISSKGTLRADYDRKGDLVGTFQSFKNIRPPLYIARDILSNYKGWTIVKNTYVAKTIGEIIDSEKYKFRLEKDGKRMTVKMEGNNVGLGVASVTSLD